MKKLVLLLFFAIVITLGWNRGASQSEGRTQRQPLLEARRENFATGRQLLIEKRVPFDPDALLQDNWAESLKGALATIPEMHENRYETAPLRGAYLADTLYLPEKVQLSGHTLILANDVVFEGKNPVIKGNYDIHFFPAHPVAVLGTSLAETLGKRPALVSVRLGRKPALPALSLMRDLVEPGSHVITFDTSGPPPKPAKPARRPAGNLRAGSWTLFQPVFWQSGDQNTSGADGTPGSPGSSPLNGLPGTNEPPSGDGDCSNPGNGSNNGEPGEPGGIGESGEDATDGMPGGNGTDAGNINVNVADPDTNAYNYIANGGAGGQGGAGGAGANGGAGGNGGNGGAGVACGCSVGNGGSAGSGGDGGKGGAGGNGAAGGNGGKGGTITVSLPWNTTGPASAHNLGGLGGRGGDAGPDGAGAPAGVAGRPALGASACGNFGATGSSSFAGKPGHSGKPGSPGPVGANGLNGPDPQIIPRSAPGGGAGGGDGTPCDGDGSGFSQNGSQGGCGSPIIIDVEREGFHLTSAQAGVAFDISGTGHPVQIAWTDAHYQNAFLALPGSDGLIHNGKELFGNFTPQPASAHPNGFLALAQFDKLENGGNGDGIIDEHDTVFSRLRLWIDANHDGICQPGELHTLPELGVFSLSLSYFESRRTDEFGNQFRYKARVDPGTQRDPLDETPSGIPGRWTYDVFLTTK